MAIKDNPVKLDFGGLHMYMSFILDAQYLRSYIPLDSAPSDACSLFSKHSRVNQRRAGYVEFRLSDWQHFGLKLANGASRHVTSTASPPARGLRATRQQRPIARSACSCPSPSTVVCKSMGKLYTYFLQRALGGWRGAVGKQCPMVMVFLTPRLNK